jgi:hypothetical protein
VERHRRAASVAALVLVLTGAGAGPALGDDAPPPPLLPPGVTAPTPRVTPSSGPTFVITPGSPGDELGQPVSGQSTSGKPATDGPAKKPRRPAASGTRGVAPTAKGPAQAGAPSSAGSAAEATWWKVGAGALLVLVLSELVLVGFRRRSA